MTLDRLEPPAGTVRRISGLAEPSHAGLDAEIGFTGWLGLLRALSELIGSPADRPPGDAG